MTDFGCKKGGTPYCPNLKKNEEPVMVCKNGELKTRNDILRTQALQFKKKQFACICPDGIMPKCRNSKDYLKCPDGSDIDFSLGSPGAYVNECNKEDFDF